MDGYDWDNSWMNLGVNPNAGSFGSLGNMWNNINPMRNWNNMVGNDGYDSGMSSQVPNASLKDAGVDMTNDWNTIGGWGKLAGIAAGGAKSILGFQQLSEYQRQFDLMTAFKNRDVENQAKLTNASMAGRQRALIGGTGQAGDVHGNYNTVAQQMSQYGVNGSKIS